MTNLTFGNAAIVPGRHGGRPKTLAFSSLSGTSKQVPSIITIRSPWRNAPNVSALAMGRTNWWNNWLITLAPNRCLACVIADLHGTRQYFPTLTHASDIPSIKFFNTSLIESLDQKLIAITRQTTSCAGNERLRDSRACVPAIACSIASAGIAISIALSMSWLSSAGVTNEKSLRCITLNFPSWP